MQALRQPAPMRGSQAPVVSRQGVRGVFASPSGPVFGLSSACPRRGVSRRDVTVATSRTEPRKSNLWESARIVCDDGEVPASLEMLAMASPLLRSKIETALEQMAPTPTIADYESPGGAKDDDVGCFPIAQPVELKSPGTTVEEWQQLLQQLHHESPWTSLDYDTIDRVMSLAQKMGMTKLISSFDSAIKAKLVGQLCLNSDYWSYMIKWLLLADRYQLKETVALCISTIKPAQGLAPAMPTKGYCSWDYRKSFYGIIENDHSRLDELKQLSSATLMQVLQAYSQESAQMRWHLFSGAK